MGRNEVKSAGKFTTNTGSKVHFYKNSKSLMLTIPEVDLTQEDLSPLREKEDKKTQKPQNKKNEMETFSKDSDRFSPRE